MRRLEAGLVSSGPVEDADVLHHDCQNYNGL